MPASVNMSVDLPKVTNAIDTATIETLHIFERQVLDKVTGDIWKGFKYGEYYPPEQRGTSGESWRTRKLSKGDGGRFALGFVLENKAEVQARTGTYEPKYWGRPSGTSKPYANNNVGQYYAAFVQKSGASRPLYLDVIDMIKTDLVPDFQTELLINILNALSDNRETRDMRLDKGGEFFEFDL